LRGSNTNSFIIVAAVANEEAVLEVKNATIDISNNTGTITLQAYRYVGTAMLDLKGGGTNPAMLIMGSGTTAVTQFAPLAEKLVIGTGSSVTRPAEIKAGGVPVTSEGIADTVNILATNADATQAGNVVVALGAKAGAGLQIVSAINDYVTTINSASVILSEAPKD
jgi:UDP-N-acetylglucosamine 2-epimerase